jgi:hypothetical protein
MSCKHAKKERFATNTPKRRTILLVIFENGINYGFARGKNHRPTSCLTLRTREAGHRIGESCIVSRAIGAKTHALVLERKFSAQAGSVQEKFLVVQIRNCNAHSPC